MDDTIEKRQIKNKEMLLEHFKKIPNVQIVCEKIGIGRATYYRWRQDSEEFARKADAAIEEGNLLMNDMTEGQLISLIKDKHPTAIFYWLNHRHPAYKNKIEITTTSISKELAEDQLEELIQLLYNKNTFRQGQTLLTGYVFRGMISERMAQLILKIFMSQMRTEDILTRKAEAEIMTEVMTRKAKYKVEKKLKHGFK
jgi:flagellar motor switch protein FliG